MRKQGDGSLQVENGGYQFYTASKWENRALLVQGFETLCISSMFWPFDGSQLLTQTCPLSMAMSQSKHRIKSNEPKLHNAYSCSGVYCTYCIIIIYVVRTCFCSIVVIFIHIQYSKWFTSLPCWLSIQGTCKEACLPNPNWVLDVLLSDAACR